MNGRLESARQSRRELNALAEGLERSYLTADASCRQAITELLRVREAVLTAHALEQHLTLNRARLMTPGQALVSPSMQRLTLYCTLIEEISKELRSIAPIRPVEAASASLPDQG